MTTKDSLVDDRDAAISVAEQRKNALGTGRIGMYTALGAATGTVPLPWVPDVLARRLRGALAQDVSGRHGLSLTQEARDVLAAPDGGDSGRGVLGQALKYATGKLLARFTPLGFLPPLRTGAQVFALGHLLDRYIVTKRNERSIRIDVQEARTVRKAIDGAVLAALRTELRAEPALRLTAPEDLRDEATQLLDGVLIAAASLPDWIVRRLNAAFDEGMQS